MNLCGMTRHKFPTARTGLAAWIFLLAAIFAVSPTLAREKLPQLIQFSIQDENGNFFHEGEIEFCTPEGECLFADIHPGFPGHFFLPSADLQPDVPYTVFVYDKEVKVLFEMRGWTFIPADYDPAYSAYWEMNQFLIFPHFTAHADRRLTFHLETTLNPEWQVVTGLGYGDQDYDNLPDWPTFLARVEMPFLFGGNFQTSGDAAGGIISLRQSYGLGAVWRSKYPRVVPHRDRGVWFREFGVAYNQTRYETEGVYYPGRDSDVKFHRLLLTYGIGRMDQGMQNHWGLSGVLGVGGIYDGTRLVRYLSRDFQMVGVGVQATFQHELFETRRLRVGLSVKARWLYYPSDGDENDHWYGSAPSAAVGLVFY